MRLWVYKYVSNVMSLGELYAENRNRAIFTKIFGGGGLMQKYGSGPKKLGRAKRGRMYMRLQSSVGIGGRWVTGDYEQWCYCLFVCMYVCHAPKLASHILPDVRFGHSTTYSVAVCKAFLIWFISFLETETHFSHGCRNLN